MVSGKKKPVLLWLRWPLLLASFYVIPYHYFLYKAHLPKDPCYFHTHRSSSLQNYFIDGSGHIERYRLEFPLIVLLLLIAGLLIEHSLRKRRNANASLPHS